MQFANILLRILASMFLKRYWPEVFFLHCVFVWFCDQDDAGFIKRVWESSISLDFFEQSVKDRGQLFLKCFVEFSCEAICSRAFVCWEFFDDCFNFLCCSWSVQVFCFFFIRFWKILCSQKYVHLTQVLKFLGIQFLVVISYNPLYFCGIECNFSSFVSDFIYFGLLPFFLDESG